MEEDTLHQTIFDVLKVLSEQYPDIYREDGMNPASNRVAGFLMQEIAQQRMQQQTQLNG